MKRVLVASMFIMAGLHGFAQYDVAVEAPDTTTASTVPAPELPTNDSTFVQRTLPTSGTQQFSDLKSQISALNAQISALQADLSNLKSQLSTLKSTASLSYDSVLRAMPQYAIVQHRVAELRKAYEAEMKRVEDEFNQKYEEFLTAQQAMAPAIRQKRQAELQELMEKNIAFKGEAARLLEAARLDAEKPLKETLNNLLADIGRENGFAFILNTDDNACPYIDADMGEDIGPEVLKRLSTP